MNGSIPNSFKNLKNLEYFIVRNNSLSATIPSGMINPRLQIFDVGYNKLTGPIPSYLGLPYRLVTFYACNNRLTQSFPFNAFYLAVSLVYLDINNNQMTGDVAYDLNMTNLQLSKLEQIDISNNFFTGELPAIVFELPKLVIFNAGGNCIKGKLPNNLCNSTILSTLILNGLYSASVCRKLIFPNIIFNFKTYFSTANVIEDIPDCIYNMTSLNTLFLSGNGITGTLSKDIVFSPNLQNLVLSNNRIEGEIPRKMSERSWQNLDLSNNKIDGTLSPSFHGVSNESSLALNNNRISGDIPSSLMNALHINILSSNIFSCESLLVRGPFPGNNPKNKTYQCGSYNFNIASLFLFTVIITALIYLRYYGNMTKDKNFSSSNGKIKRLGNSESFVNTIFLKTTYIVMGDNFYTAIDFLQKSGEDSKIQSSEKISNITAFYNEFDLISVYLRNIFVFKLFFWLPSATIINRYYSVYTYSYSWSVSLLYLSGFFPVLVKLSFVFMLCIIIFWYVFYKIENVEEIFKEENKCLRVIKKKIIKIFILIVNFVVMFLLNTYYVKEITKEYWSNYVIYLEISVSIIKFLWNNVAIEYLSNFSMAYQNKNYNEVRKQKDIAFRCYINIVNFLLCPFITTAFLHEGCFYEAINEQKPVIDHYTSTYCSYVNSTGCEEYKVESNSYSFVPPFQYSFLCTSALASIYTPIYMFTSILMMFQIPISKMSNFLFCFVINLFSTFCRKDCIPSCIKPLEIQLNDKHSLNPQFEIFVSSPFVVNIISYIVLLFTIGLVVPLLGLSLIICLLIYLHWILADLGKILIDAKKGGSNNYYHVLQILERNCEGIPRAINFSLYSIIPSSIFFYSFFLFDMIGDDTNTHTASKVLISGLVMFVLYLLSSFTITRIKKIFFVKMIIEFVNKNEKTISVELSKTISDIEYSGDIENSTTDTDMIDDNIENPIRTIRIE
jgi:hypothetical protein